MKGLYQIWTDESYVYAATSSGLEITNIETEEITAWVTSADGCTTVWSDESEVIIGTTSSGLKRLAKSAIKPGELTTALTEFAIDEDITSNSIKYVHGNSNRIVCCTTEGVDVFRRDIAHRAYTTISGAVKCIITKNYGYLYYIVSGTSINKLSNASSNWSTSDTLYSVGTGFLIDATAINDMFVTEHTSLGNSDNTLFVATDVGVFIYDEGTDEHSRYY